MHRAINIKHRVVRRVDIGKAPLATFDTVDLGDDDVCCIGTAPGDHVCNIAAAIQLQHPTVTAPVLFLRDGGLKSETIGGNSSKKSLSQAGGEDKKGKHDQPAEDLPAHANGSKDVVSPESGSLPKGNVPSHSEQVVGKSSSPQKSPDTVQHDNDRPRRDPPHRQDTLGRVNIPIKKQDSESSSSSNSTDDNPCTFQACRPSIRHICAPESKLRREFVPDPETQCTLLPDNLDPSQILSPSKRKAYERRIERLKVTTSPIARPRSTAPISVVTLDEYANINSSPEASPASPSHIHDKLKITLPLDEFNSKPRAPKLSSSKRDSAEDGFFEFTEEILFSRTKSALVVEDDGQLPLSPRRVLIPPTLTPATSPKLSASPKFLQESSEDDAVKPKLIYIQQSETAQKIFGETVDVPDEENWANFDDNDSFTTFADQDEIISVEKAETEEKEKDFVQRDFQESFSSDGLKTDSSLEAFEHSNTFPVTELHIAGEETDTKPRVQEQGEAFEPSKHFSVLSEKPCKFEPCSVPQVDDIVFLVKNNEVPHSVSDPTGCHVDFEEEEILTIEIQESEETNEKKIEIDVKSSGSSSAGTPEHQSDFSIDNFSKLPPRETAAQSVDSVSVTPHTTTVSDIAVDSNVLSYDIPTDALETIPSQSTDDIKNQQTLLSPSSHQHDEEQQQQQNLHEEQNQSSVTPDFPSFPACDQKLQLLSPFDDSLTSETATGQQQVTICTNSSSLPVCDQNPSGLLSPFSDILTSELTSGQQQVTSCTDSSLPVRDQKPHVVLSPFKDIFTTETASGQQQVTSCTDSSLPVSDQNPPVLLSPFKDILTSGPSSSQQQMTSCSDELDFGLEQPFSKPMFGCSSVSSDLIDFSTSIEEPNCPQ